MKHYFATAKEMEQLDILAVEHGLSICQMMELAGWHMAQVLQELAVATDKKVAIVCGQGNKGGDGLSAARHLANKGYLVSIILASTDLKPDPEHHLMLLQHMDIPIMLYESDAEHINNTIRKADVIVDALLGYHLEGNPRGAYADLIEQINKAKKMVVAYDIPSGVDATTGECLEPCIKAAATLTLALPKKVFETDTGKRKSGKVFLADIGIPSFLYDQIAKKSRPDFGNNGVVALLNT